MICIYSFQCKRFKCQVMWFIFYSLLLLQLGIFKQINILSSNTDMFLSLITVNQEEMEHCSSCGVFVL